ncbi:MAG: putative Ig domain-containing protein, partial [Betaproteobacteria bacterium]
VLSLNATLASGVLIGRAGQSYRTQADLLGFFAKVQQWYGDTARWAGDADARRAPVDYEEVRDVGFYGQVFVPVPVAPDRAAYDRNARAQTHFVSFDVFAGGRAELEYLRHIGLLDQEFKPVGAPSLGLTQYLQALSSRGATATADLTVRGPQAVLSASGDSYVPADYALPYAIGFTNPGNNAVGELRLVTQLDQDLDPASLRLGDLKVGDINVHVPAGLAAFQGDFDFTGNKGFVLRVSAGIDAVSRIATWLIQAIDPDTGEVLRDPARGLLLPSANGQRGSGSASYTVRAAQGAATGATLQMQARAFFDAAPPIDSASVSHKLDAAAPGTTLEVRSAGADAQGRPTYRLEWNANDDASGVRHVTLYVAENGGDFRIWQRQLTEATGSRLFTGQAGKTYEFIAVATDLAGNREAASVSRAVLPDDGSRADAERALGSNETFAATPVLPAAQPDRSYADNTMFDVALQQLPGFVVPGQTADLRSVLAPMQLRGFASGFAGSAGDIGALAMVQLADGSVLASAGAQRNQVFRFGPEGGRSLTPLFELDSAVLDMALDASGQLWALTGAELLLLDAASGAVLARHRGPGGEPLTHALAIDPAGLIYVSTGDGVAVFDPRATDASRAWRAFSHPRVGDLAFGPDGRLWGVRWSGSQIASADPAATTEIVSFPMSGRTAGRAELEYRLAGLVDSIAFGQAGSGLQGLLLASSNLPQRPTGGAAGSALPHTSAVWMVELASRRVVQLAQGGTRGETLLATPDGRVLVAQSSRIDEIAPIKAPRVVGASVGDGALVPLPLTQLAVAFDQPMWTGADGADTRSPDSVLNPANYGLVATGANAGRRLAPVAVRWDAGTRSAVLTLPNLPAGGWRLEVGTGLRSASQVALASAWSLVFTAVADISNQVQLVFGATRAERVNGSVTYDVSITNIGSDDIRGPLMLLLDPGRYFDGSVAGGSAGSGEQDELWVIDLKDALTARGGRLASGQTLSDLLVTVQPAARFGTGASGTLVKANLGHGIYAVPYDNTPPTLEVIDAASGAPAEQSAPLPGARAGEPWSATLRASDTDGSLLFWELLQAPAGMSLQPQGSPQSGATGYSQRALLMWTPTPADRADNEVLLRVVDSRGGVAIRRLALVVDGGNRVPVIDPVPSLVLAEGDTLELPLKASDEDGQPITLLLRNLPAGARFDAQRQLLTWTPGYAQAGDYNDIVVVASDGIHQTERRFNLRVLQGVPAPVFAAVPQQVLREGDAHGLQLPGSVPGGLEQPDGSRVTLSWTAPWLPAGATLDEDTGWFAWTPGFAQAGSFELPVTLLARFTAADGSTRSAAVLQRIRFEVRNANGAPRFDPAETWQVAEGQPLRVSVFAFDPDNPDFEPRIRFLPGSAASPGNGVPATVHYEVTGLPPGARFDEDTLEVVWTPGYAQAGSYQVTVRATDDGNGTGTPASSELRLPIIVRNANRTPELGALTGVTVERGAVLNLPVQATDADGNPITLTIQGLPPFASYEQTETAAGRVTGVLRIAPGAQARGAYTITVLAQDDGDGDVNQVAVASTSFVLTVRSPSEAPVITLARQAVAVAGQELRLPVQVSDLDQDELSYLVQGLPDGARLEQGIRYGEAWIVWTPTAAQLGSHDLKLRVTDKGLPPANGGYTVDPANPPAPNTTVADLRIVVRSANQTAIWLGVSASGGLIEGDALAGVRTVVLADEGRPLTLDLSALDPDLDLLDWQLGGLPSGMVAQPAAGTDGQANLRLRWTPDAFAAQGGTARNGVYSLTVTASDGHARLTRQIELRVRNVNQAPQLLRLPLQLVPEGQTLAFQLRASDPDGDAVRLALVYDDATPAGVLFDPATGTFEWTPDQDAVDNNAAGDRAFNLTFSATDGNATTYRTVQVRVFDVNRAPQIETANRALLVGQPLAINVVRGATAAPGSLRLFDGDGGAQTAALSVSFSGLPEGARYDAASGRLLWTPGPGQVADHLVLATVSDGRNSVTRGFMLRVVADRAANAPGLLVNLTPSTPALPGQQVLATVRAQGFSPIVQLQVHARGAALGLADWTALTPDAMGRLRLLPTAAGVAELRVRAVDADGFENTTVQTLRVRDPQDSAAPALAWGGALAAALAGADPQRPVTLSDLSELTATVDERQLMGWVLEAAPAGGATIEDAAWRVVAERSEAAVARSGQLALATLDPRLWPNGVLALRLRAWDLGGRTSEITARVQIDTATKNLRAAVATDATFTLGGHSLALVRSFEPARTAAGTGVGDFGNWTLPLLSAQLSHDQPLLGGLDAAAAWREGARVWLQMPSSLALADAPTLQLAFTLRTQTQALSTEPTAPQLLRPRFEGDAAGWTLRATQDDGAQAPALQLQGSRLLDRETGLPWVPQRWELTAPDGTRYSLDAAGRISAVRFADGALWLVSDAGIALAGSVDAQQRVAFERDSAGRIERVVGLVGDKPTSIVYRYDTAGRLALVRSLYGEASLNLSLGYRADGSLMTEPLTAHLGAAGDWTAASATPRNAWSGTLAAGASAHFGFVVRDSELRSAAKLRGAAGTLLYAVETTGVDTPLVAEGATVVGRGQVGGRTVTLLRVTDAGLVRVSLAGSGAASLRVSLAGDIDRDGAVDGADSAAWEAAHSAGRLEQADLDGDGLATPADRQILYANYGFKANRAPVAQAAAQPLLTHTDLARWALLDNVAVDHEGDTVYWRVLGATHGTARLALDGSALLFQPEAGFAGTASITVQADDGYAASEPIVLQFNVSGAALLAIHVREIAPLRAGQAVEVQAFGDFADEKGVALTGNYLQWSVHNAQSGVGKLNTTVGGQQLSTVRDGWGYVLAQRGEIKGVRVFEVGGPKAETRDLSRGGMDLYPGSVTLASPDPNGAGAGTRQIRLTQVYDDKRLEDSPFTTYVVGDGRVVSVDATGRITARAAGTTRVYAIHKNKQEEITVHVAMPTLVAPGQAIEVDSAGALLQSASGVQVAIAAGAFEATRNVRLQDLALGADELPRLTGAVSLGTFRLDLGGADSAMPIQLALPAGGYEPSQYEMLVFRRGPATLADGSTRDIWWLVDNGVIGADGIARTASPPYPGVYQGGDYAIYTRPVSRDSQTGARTLQVAAQSVNWVAVVQATANLGAMLASAGSGNLGAALYLMGKFVDLLDDLVEIEIQEVTTTAQYFRTAVLRRDSGGELRLDVSPPPVLKAGDPVITSVQQLGSGSNEFRLTGSDFTVSGGGQTELRAWIRPIGGSALRGPTTSPDRGLVWMQVPLTGVTNGAATVTLPTGVAIGLHELWVERFPRGSDPSDGRLRESNKIQFKPAEHIGVLLDRGHVQFTRSPGPSAFGATPLEVLPDFVTLPGPVTGGKTDPLAYGADGRVVFVAGAGRIYMIDMISRKLVAEMSLPGAANITAMAFAGDWLYLAESGENAHLWRVKVEPKSRGFLTSLQQLTLPDSVEIGPSGILDLAVSGGRYLAFTAPLDPNGRFGRYLNGVKGNVYVIDLQRIDYTFGGPASTATLVVDPATGEVEFPPNVLEGDIAKLEFTGERLGQYPMYIAPGPMPGQFVFSTPGAFNKGFAAAKVSRGTEDDAPLTATVIPGPWLVPDSSYLGQPRLVGAVPPPVSIGLGTGFLQNIQKAAGVAVTADGQWAFVADFNMPWREPGFEDGFYASRQLGGKIGIIRNPFTDPVYMGATTPIEDVLLDNLSMSSDGQRLLVTGLVFEDNRTFGTVFDYPVQGLIGAALQHVDLTKPVDLDRGDLLPRRYDDLPKAYPLAALSSSGSVQLISPTFARGDAAARPEFELKGTRNIVRLRLFLSSFGPGDGLFPDDRPRLPDWAARDKNASGPAHNERIATIDVDLSGFAGGVLPAGHLFTIDDFTKPMYEDFRLTAGQQYWWGVEATFDNGLQTTEASQFKVRPAWKDNRLEGSSVTILTHGFQPPLRSGTDGVLSQAWNINLAAIVAGGDTTGEGLTQMEMALRIARDQGGFAYRYDKTRGTWEPMENGQSLANSLAAGVPVTLVPDWVLESGFSDSGFSEAAADAIYASLLRADQACGGKLLSGNLHLIGHSRGTVVNSELAQRILWGADRYGLPRPRDLQMTALDPHDFKQ